MSDLVGRTVWLVEVGCYEEAYISGVYATVEAAIAAHPPARVIPPDFVSSSSYSARPGGWRKISEERWSNGLDWDDAASAYAYVIQGDPA